MRPSARQQRHVECGIEQARRQSEQVCRPAEPRTLREAKERQQQPNERVPQRSVKWRNPITVPCGWGMTKAKRKATIKQPAPHKTSGTPRKRSPIFSFLRCNADLRRLPRPILQGLREMRRDDALRAR